VYLFCSFMHSALASQAPPAPVCEVEAEVLNLNEVEYCDNVVTYVRLLADVKIIATGKKLEDGYQPDYKDFNCPQAYQGKIVKAVSVPSDKHLKVGQKVKGNIRYFADEFWQGDILEDVVVLEDVKVKE